MHPGVRERSADLGWAPWVAPLMLASWGLHFGLGLSEEVYLEPLRPTPLTLLGPADQLGHFLPTAITNRVTRTSGGLCFKSQELARAVTAPSFCWPKWVTWLSSKSRRGHEAPLTANTTTKGVNAENWGQ